MSTYTLSHTNCGLDMRLPLPSLLFSSQPEIVGMDQEPLLVFVNGKSGGNQGVALLHAFRRHLNPHQVFDLANGGPLPG